MVKVLLGLRLRLLNLGLDGRVGLGLAVGARIRNRIRVLVC